MKDAQGKQDAGQRLPLAGLNVGDNLGGQQVAHAVQFQQLFLFQEIDVGQVFDQPNVDEDAAPLLAQTIDVHRALADKVLEQLEELGGTTGVGTAVHRVAFVLDHGGAADGADLGHLKYSLVSGTAGHHRPHHLRDYVSGPLHHHVVTNANVLALDVLLVVQRGVADRGPADHHRLQNGVGVETAGAPDVDANVQQSGDDPLRRKFVGDCPAGLPTGHAQRILIGEGIDLHHHSVGLVAQVVAALQPGMVVIRHLVQGLTQLVVGIHSKAQSLEPLHRLPMVVGIGLAAGVHQVIDPNLHVALGGYPRVQVADSSRAGVARVGVQRFAFGLLLLIQASKALQGHVDLTAYFQVGRRVTHQGQRDAAYCAQVLGHILAGGAVASGSPLNQRAVLVD